MWVARGKDISPSLCCYGRTLLNLSATLAIASISLVTVSPSFFFSAFCCYGNNPFLLSLVTSSSLYPSLGHLLFQMVAMAISLSQLCLPNNFSSSPLCAWLSPHVHQPTWHQRWHGKGRPLIQGGQPLLNLYLPDGWRLQLPSFLTWRALAVASWRDCHRYPANPGDLPWLQS